MASGSTRSVYLFVYGTLRRGFATSARAVLRRKARYIGKARYRGRLFDAGEYPAAVPSRRAPDQIVGELYEVEDTGAVFAALDEYEGYDRRRPRESEFRRANVTVTAPDGRKVRAWAYLYNKPVAALEPIPARDYAAYVVARRSQAQSRS